MTGPPTLSVIIPVFNGEAFVGQAIESVFAQRHPSTEIVVIDDGSTDGSAAAVAAYPGVRYFAQPNSGVATARNAGLARARGELIGFLDQDDLWPEGRIDAMLPRFEADPDLEALYGMTLTTYKGVRKATRGFMFLLGSALFRRGVFDRLDWFDASVRYYADDADFYLRLREGPFHLQYVDYTTLIRRVHGKNTSLHMEGAPKAGLVEILKRSLDRRRADPDISLSPLPDFTQIETILPNPEEDDA